MDAPRLLYEALSFPLAAAAGAWVARKPSGRVRLGERFGGWDLPPDDYLWFHGASAGEVTGLLPVVRRVGRPSGARTLLTATTLTGLGVAAEDAARGVVDESRLLPFDNPLLVGRALGRARPTGLVVAETEIWPSLFGSLGRRGAPVVIVNARVSDYSYPRYRAARPFIRGSLAGVAAVLAADHVSAERLVSLGCRREAVAVAGNTKYDIAPPSPAGIDAVRRLLGVGPPVVVLGSVRPGEERWWLEAVRGAGRGSVRLVVVPRHLDRLAYFTSAVSAAGLTPRLATELRLSGGTAVADDEVLVLDTFGELRAAYAVAALAFVGGSLVDAGGHNPLEAALSAVAVATGPHVANVRHVTSDLRAAGAAWEVRTAGDVARLVAAAAGGDGSLAAAGRAGREVWGKHSGATGRVAAAVSAVVGAASAGRTGRGAR